jgi:hypothetical protein
MFNDFVLYVYIPFILYTMFYSQYNVHVNMFDFILHIFRATVLYSKRIKTKLLHNTAVYL